MAETKRKGKYKLSKLSINRVDLVPAGDNPEAQIMIFKGHKPDNTENEENKMNEVEKLQKEIEDLKKSLKDAQDKAVADAAIATTAADLAKTELEKAKKEVTDVQAALETVKKEKAAIEATDEDIIKSITDPNARAIAQRSFEKAKAAEASAKASQEALLVSEITKSVETELPNLKGTVEEKVKLVKVCKQALPADIFTQLMDVAKAANAIIKESDILKEKGNGGGGDNINNNTAEAKINAIAKTLVDTKVCKSMPEAISKAATDNKDLYAEYVKEQKAKSK